MSGINDPAIVNEIEAMCRARIAELETELEEIVSVNHPSMANIIRNAFWNAHESHLEELANELDEPHNQEPSEDLF